MFITKLTKNSVIVFVFLLTTLLVPTQAALACGGLFCQNIPVDQAAERIIFTIDPGEVSAYVQINYIGDAPNFAWVVPVPAVPEVDVAEMDSFTELQTATDPVFMLPPVPECMFDNEGDMAMPSFAVEESAEAEDVTVYASGEAGPYEYDVVGTETSNVNALIDWLNENNYRITPEMKPLVFVYVEEQMIFLAMKLQPDQGVQDIQPVKMTYQSQQPMIPLRLTAVAATPNMGVYTWVFGRAQTESQNYARLEISDDDLSLIGPFGGGTNYLQMVGQGVDRFEGKAFITEYAQPTSQLNVIDPLLQELRQHYPYVTRFYGQLSPDEMTVDPVFDLNNNLSDMSNIHDLTYRTDMYACQDEVSNVEVSTSTDNGNQNSNNINSPDSATTVPISYVLWGAIGAACLIGMGIVLGGGVVFLARRK